MPAIEKATFGSGCFWCTEAIFQRIPGVLTVIPGYSGGLKPKPTYDEVCTGATGHAEVAQISFDPSKTTYDRLLDVFWECHDPTTLNRQGGDVGTQYRSVIFYEDNAQRQAAEKSKVNVQQKYRDPIVTQIEPLRQFYKAEDYHLKYFDTHPNAPYCALVIKPKLQKLQLK